MLASLWCCVPLTVKDLRAKVSFSQQVKTNLIRPNYGRWSWSPLMKKPSWNALKTAPLWKDEEHAAARAALSKEPVAVQTLVGGDAEVQQLMIRPPGSDRDVTMTVYNASQDMVPAGMAGVQPRAAVVLLDGTNYLAPQLKAQMEHIAVMLFGHPKDVTSMQHLIEHNLPDRIVHLVWVYVKPRQPDPRQRDKYHNRGMLLVGDEAVLNFQVWTLQSLNHIAWHCSPGLLRLFCARTRINLDLCEFSHKRSCDARTGTHRFVCLPAGAQLPVVG